MSRPGIALLLSAGLLGILAGGASAATVSVEPVSEKGVSVADRLILRAAPGEDNSLVVMPEAAGVYTVADRVPLTAGARCQPISGLQARCTGRPDEFWLRADLGDGDDYLDAAGFDANSARLLGGRGDDHIVGPVESLGTTFVGGPGDDRMEGGSGWDVFQEGAKRNGADTFIGGSSADPRPFAAEDTVDYSHRRHALSVTMDGRRNDGEKGELDRIASDMELVLAGTGDDRMIGNGRVNEFDGGAGHDVLRGGSGDDYLVGDQYALRSPNGQGDVLVGGPGADRLDGGRGDDRLNGGAGPDSLISGSENDLIDADDGALDAILCGPGRDRIRHDGADFMDRDCGRRHGPIPAHVVPLAWSAGGDLMFLALGCPYRPGRSCTSEAKLELAGQTFGPKPFTLESGRYGFLALPVDLPLDGGVLTIGSETMPLTAFHRDYDGVPFFLPPVVPLL
jgi:RTX calcium-binding nonapeptide repeat (4 copies)